jgi:hypothetical protein
MQLASRPSSARRDLYSAYQQQYQYNDQYGAEASGGGVTPLTAVRPSRESTYQQQDQYNSQYQPHFPLLFFRYGWIFTLYSRDAQNYDRNRENQSARFHA